MACSGRYPACAVPGVQKVMTVLKIVHRRCKRRGYGHVHCIIRFMNTLEAWALRQPPRSSCEQSEHLCMQASSRHIMPE